MARAVYLLFGVFAYLVFFATFLYLIAFTANLPEAMLTVDRGPRAPVPIAILVDMALIALFGVQHSVMARKGFKAAWTRVVPEPVERSVYVLFASLALIVMFLFWRPITYPIWSIANETAVWLIWGLFGLGWLIVLLSTFLINHFELFGLHQVWANVRGAELPEARFREPLFYRRVRHPIYAGFILAFYATPHMTAGHLLLALGLTVYILIAIRYEERDLVALFGKDYEDYRTRTGKLVPKLGRRA
ncbi:MAG: methanethiol S-methyltransferase [Sphingosinicella sp.]